MHAHRADLCEMAPQMQKPFPQLELQVESFGKVMAGLCACLPFWLKMALPDGEAERAAASVERRQSDGVEHDAARRQRRVHLVHDAQAQGPVRR